jgi:hypothetical protein
VASWINFNFKQLWQMCPSGISAAVVQSSRVEITMTSFFPNPSLHPLVAVHLRCSKTIHGVCMLQAVHLDSFKTVASSSLHERRMSSRATAAAGRMYDMAALLSPGDMQHCFGLLLVSPTPLGTLHKPLVQKPTHM